MKIGLVVNLKVSPGIMFVFGCFARMRDWKIDLAIVNRCLMRERR